ncbi:MAG: ZIP family metal transporter, partial [Bacteroidales bacterium]
VSIPLRREGFGRGKAFFIGQLSGFVEPIAAVIGAYLVVAVTAILPYALAFAAGAMIFVVIEELIPESQSGQETDLSTIGALIGFTIMMFLDVALS